MKVQNSITRYGAKTKDEVVGNIYRTYNYKEFKLNKVNRAISEKHVAEIVHALKVKKVKLPLIQVNPQMEIIDGQHRFKALMEVGLPIYYYIDRQSNDEAIIEINSKQSRWHLPQFIHARAEQNCPGYKELENLVNHYKAVLSPSSVVAIFSGDNDWRGGSKTKMVREGEFKFGNKEKATEFLEKIADARSNLVKARQLNNSLVLGIWAYYNHPKVNREKLFLLINDNFVARAPRNRDALMEFIGQQYNKQTTRPIKFSLDFHGKFSFAE